MSKYKYEKEFLFSSKAVQDIEAFLQSKEGQIDLMLVRDHQNSTVIHHCAYHNQHQLLILYLNYHRKQIQQITRKISQIKLKTQELINSANSQGYTPAHFAAYRGHVHILRLLHKYHADLTLLNGIGMGLPHLAAQGDKPATLLFLHPLELPLHNPDHKASTPLHWAAFSGSHKTVEYLLAQPTVDPNSQDSDGHTPLHLAAAYGHSGIVKQLLLTGTSRTITNNKGLTALDIARENEFDRIISMLNDRYSCVDRMKFICNAKVKYEPQYRSYLQPICFVVMWLLAVGMNFGAVQLQPLWLLGAIGGLFLFVMGLFLSLVAPPPQNKPPHPYEYYTERHQVNQLCMNCIRLEQPRERHCFVCGVCVAQYDHHCPWINNCVGKRNIARFYFMLLLLLSVLITNTLVAAKVIILLEGGEWETDTMVIREWVRPMPWLLTTVSSISLFQVAFFTIPLLLLILVQSKNLLLGRTTFQRFSKRNTSIITGDSLVIDPTEGVTKASMENCLRMCRDQRHLQAVEEKSQSTKLSWMQQ